MTYLLDVNVLLALAWPMHVHHGPAQEWFGNHHRSGWATCGVTESGFIRVSSNRRATPAARSPGEAALLLHRMCQLDGHVFLDDSVRLSKHPEVISAHVHGSSQVTDAHLILIARASSASLVTFDRGVAQLAPSLGAETTLLSS